MFEAQSSVSTLQCDSAKEFTGRSSPFVITCNQLGLTLRYTSPYAHHSNGKVERGFRIIQDGARSLMMQAELDASWWPHAVMHCIYVLNRIPTRERPSPYFLVTGKEPDLTSETGTAAHTPTRPKMGECEEPVLNPIHTAATRPLMPN